MKKNDVVPMGFIILVALVLLTIMFIVSVNVVTDAIEFAGGVKQILIDAGREIRFIAEEINK